MFKSIAAAAEIVNRAHLIHERPNYGIDTVPVEGRDVPIREEAFYETPFATLLRFAKQTNVEQPRVMIVAPMAGHFPTLLRNTVSTMLPDHDVFITDWKSARDVPLAAGTFGVDEYISHLITFFEKMGPRVRMSWRCASLARHSLLL